ncbi:hypothetical protein [Streptomyces lavendulocolor]|uniref:hypothetical protein n=1 Tax=Streptomyces lavendulocolor TaxID=67316 RepID=UPI0033C017F1
MEALVDDDGGHDALGSVGAEPVVDLADDLSDVDKKKAFFTGPGRVRDVRGQEVDRPVGEDTSAQAASEPTTA